VFVKELLDYINSEGEGSFWGTHLIGSVLLAPIVYTAVFSHFYDAEAITIRSLALAFQGGFFWIAAIRTLEG